MDGKCVEDLFYPQEMEIKQLRNLSFMIRWEPVALMSRSHNKSFVTVIWLCLLVSVIHAAEMCCFLQQRTLLVANADPFTKQVHLCSATVSGGC